MLQSPNNPSASFVRASILMDEPKLALLRSAEKLMAARGVQSVSLREISEAAGQRNVSAAQYHFKDRRGLIEALLLRHSSPLQAQWPAQMDALERVGALTVSVLLGLLVRGVASKLDDPDGGRDYLEICGQLTHDKEIPLLETAAATEEGALRLGAELLSRIPMASEWIGLKGLRIAAMLYHSLVSYARLKERGVEVPSRTELESELVEMLQAILTIKSAPSAVGNPRRSGRQATSR